MVLLGVASTPSDGFHKEMLSHWLPWRFPRSIRTVLTRELSGEQTVTLEKKVLVCSGKVQLPVWSKDSSSWFWGTVSNGSDSSTCYGLCCHGDTTPPLAGSSSRSLTPGLWERFPKGTLKEELTRNIKKLRVLTRLGPIVTQT